MTENDWHWLAGIWEGEGTACISQQVQRKPYKVGKRIVVTISQKDVQMLAEVKHLLGCGSIHPGNRASIWVIASKTAREFLLNLYPYVRTARRREQILYCIKTDADERAKAKTNLIASNRKRARKSEAGI